MSNLRDEILKESTVRYAKWSISQKLYSNGTGSDVKSKSQQIVEIGIDDLMGLFNKHIEELLPKDNTSMSGYMTASLDEIAGYQKALDDIKAKLKE